jgi:dihydroneopterin aldolase
VIEMRNRDLIVVKLGGSHVGSRCLAEWLDVLSGCAGRAILVPGGGPFADAVRAAQAKMGFDDRAAHHMALLAMEQFGCALASLRPGLCAVGSLAAIRKTLRAGEVPIWSPAAMALRAADVPASWEVTSDSLAAWLAGRLGAKRLLLVKHGDFSGHTVQASDLAARGIVDPAFPRFLAASGAQASIVPSEAYALAPTTLGAGTMPGVPIDLHASAAKGLLSSSWPSSRRHAGDGR